MMTQLIIVIGIMIIPLCASIYCHSSYGKYKKIKWSENKAEKMANKYFGKITMGI